jgi:hypothetical protein
MVKEPDRFWNPYLAGILLGLVLLTTFLVMGKGLGASGASFRTGVWLVNTVAPAHVAGVPAMSAVTEEGHPLNDWLVFQVLGVVAGGLIGALTSGRFGREVLRGPTFAKGGRIALAIAGGAMMGFAAKLTLGCASGQGLSGGAAMSVGGWLFFFSFFGGGYAAAWFLRRQWR